MDRLEEMDLETVLEMEVEVETLELEEPLEQEIMRLVAVAAVGLVVAAVAHMELLVEQVQPDQTPEMVEIQVRQISEGEVETSGPQGLLDLRTAQVTLRRQMRIFSWVLEAELVVAAAVAVELIELVPLQLATVETAGAEEMEEMALASLRYLPIALSITAASEPMDKMQLRRTVEMLVLLLLGQTEAVVAVVAAQAVVAAALAALSG
jgi:hypothetical protein